MNWIYQGRTYPDARAVAKAVGEALRKTTSHYDIKRNTLFVYGEGSLIARMAIEDVDGGRVVRPHIEEKRSK